MIPNLKKVARSYIQIRKLDRLLRANAKIEKKDFLVELDKAAGVSEVARTDLMKLEKKIKNVLRGSKER